MSHDAAALTAASPAPPRGWRLWWVAGRPRTLLLSATPVIVGCALAWADGAPPAWGAALVALLAALLIQVGTNLHNDAADFERGTDSAGRVGPVRVTQAGWATAARVRRAAALAFAAAALGGAYLIAVGGVPILIVGLLSIAAGWAYSGGRRPISATPLGEIFVFVFFGLVAVGGSAYLQRGSVAAIDGLAGAALGLFAAAVLMLNNLRDLESDRRAGRRTLAGLLGPARGRVAYALFVAAPFGLLALLGLRAPGVLVALAALPGAARLVRDVARSPGGAGMNALLARTARMQFVFGALLALGVAL